MKSGNINTEELKKILESLGKYTDEEIRTIISSLKRFSGALNDLSDNFNAQGAEFNAKLQDVIESITKTTEKGNIDLRRVVSDMKKNYKDSIKAEQENLKKRQDILDKLNKVQESDKYNKASKEEQAYIDNQVKLLKSEITLQTQREALEKKKRDNLAKNNEIEERILKQKTELADKQAAIERVQQEANAKKEKWESRGFNKNGKKNSGAELFSKFGDIAKTLKENSLGRNVAVGLSKGIGAANGGLDIIKSGKMDVSAMAGKAAGALSNLGPYGAAAGGLIQIFASLFEMYAKVDTAASKYSRSVGGGRLTMEKMKIEAGRTAEEFNKLGGRSYDVAEMIDTMAEYSQGLGRNLEYVSDASWKAMKDLKDLGIGTDVVNMFDTIGYSVDMVSDKIGGLMGRAAGRGLNAKAVTDAMTKNLKLAQQYTFSRGMKALETMAQKSVSLKYNIEAAARFADKVGTLEGAVSAAAQLSVLGGDFAMHGNPLEMLYGGLQDVETLNEKMLSMTKNLVYWNESKGMMDMSAFDKMRLKTASQTMGVNYDDMLQMAFNQYKDRIIGDKFKDRDDMTDAQKEYLRNVAEIKDGKAYYKIDGESKELNDLTEFDIEKLKSESELRTRTQEQNVGDILENTRGIQERLDDLINVIKQRIVGMLMKLTGGDDIFETDDYSKGKGLTQAQLYDYNTLKNALKVDSVQDRQANIDALDDATKKLARESGIIDENGILTSSFRHYGKDTAQWGKTFNTLNTHWQREKENSNVNKPVDYESQVSATKAGGGPIYGPGSSTSDSINIKASNGEFIVNADATKSNFGLLNDINSGKIKSGSNPYKINSVSKIENNSYSSTNTNSHMSIEPLNINVGGKIELTSLGGGNKTLTAEELMTPQIINKIMKAIQEQTDYAFDRTKLHWKYGV